MSLKIENNFLTNPTFESIRDVINSEEFTWTQSNFDKSHFLFFHELFLKNPEESFISPWNYFLSPILSKIEFEQIHKATIRLVISTGKFESIFLDLPNLKKNEIRQRLILNFNDNNGHVQIEGLDPIYLRENSAIIMPMGTPYQEFTPNNGKARLTLEIDYL